MGGDGARGRDWRRAHWASPVPYRHNFLVLAGLYIQVKKNYCNHNGYSFVEFF